MFETRIAARFKFGAQGTYTAVLAKWW